jgi:hypothetical protein
MAPLIASEGPTPANKATMRTFVRGNMAMTIESEAAALIALGARASSGFLVVCCVLPLLLQIGMLAQTAYYRAGLNSIGRQIGGGS